jgi:antitoxin (DNA-binding transcriptional repressor) of toxin-antitoxin stability system
MKTVGVFDAKRRLSELIDSGQVGNHHQTRTPGRNP